MEWVDAARVGVAAAVLSAAAYTDVKTRMAADGLWYAGAAAGIALMALDFGLSFAGPAWLLPLAVGAVFAVAVTGGELFTVFPGDDPPPPYEQWTEPQRARWRLDKRLSLLLLGGALAGLSLASQWDLGTPSQPLAGPQATAWSAVLMVAAGLAFYWVGALHGGADAKAFMMLAVLLPRSPDLGFEPLFAGNPLARLYLPFVIVVLFNAALSVVLVAPFVFVGLSARAGNVRMPLSLAGYPKRVDRVDLAREFVLGRVVDGKFVPRAMVFRAGLSDESQRESLEMLSRTGQEVVFVSPKLPFLVYMLLGLVAAVLIGSPLLLV